jgi:hypothetical protein
MTVEFRTIGFPQNLFRVVSGSLRFENRQTTSEALLSRAVLAGGLHEQLWACDIETPTLAREDWQWWNATIAKLDGRVVLFNIPAVGQPLPLGVGAGFAESNPAYTITGTTISGTSILTGGTTAMVAETAPRYAQALRIDFGSAQAGVVVLKHGDVFGLGGNLYISTARVTADASGVARVPFRWRLWKGAEAGEIVTLRKPTFRAQLRTPDGGKVDLSVPTFGKAGLQAIEVPFLQ